MRRRSGTRILAMPLTGAFGLSCLLAGCMGGTSARSRGLERQMEYVELHPDTPKRVKQAVLGKKLVPGMPTDAIIASWGEPDSVLRLGAKDARWTYERPQTISGRRVFVEYTVVIQRGVLHAIHYQTKK